MRGENKLCALNSIYARGELVIRAQHDLCAEKLSYTRSTRFMRGENKLYALNSIYARGNLVMRARACISAIPPALRCLDKKTLSTEWRRVDKVFSFNMRHILHLLGR